MSVNNALSTRQGSSRYIRLTTIHALERPFHSSAVTGAGKEVAEFHGAQRYSAAQPVGKLR